ncbi:MAG: hypothetical protein LBS01_11825 [Prevotellaceae bacterium]|jgi:hypothetical protein|nr:hypothetical protein [Prevotellaceae bacterium]
MEITKGIKYNELLENLTANGYAIARTTDSTIVFKGENLNGIYPVADFLTEYIKEASKQVTFLFDHNGGLHSIKIEGEADENKLTEQSVASPTKSTKSFGLSNFDGFMEDAKTFVKEEYESMHIHGLQYSCGFAPASTCRNRTTNEIIGDYLIKRIASNHLNVYPAVWWATPESGSSSSIKSGIILWALLVPDNNPQVSNVHNEIILDFECMIWDFVDTMVESICY